MTSLAFGSDLRVAAIGYTTCRHRDAVLAIPTNWARITLATDSLITPELLPGVDRQPESRDLGILRFSFFIEKLRNSLEEKDVFARILFGVLVVVIGVGVFLPSILYRFALKSTCLIYAPMLFIVDDHGGKNVDLQLRKLIRSPMERYKRWYSAFVLLVLNIIPAALYFVFYKTWQDIAGWTLETFPRVAVRLANNRPVYDARGDRA